MATKKTASEKEAATKAQGAEEAKEPKGKRDGEIAAPDEVAKAVEESTQAQHQREIEELERKHAQELSALHPETKSISQEAYDATRPRGPEAPSELLKPSQRQGEGIEQGMPPDTETAGVAPQI